MKSSLNNYFTIHKRLYLQKLLKMCLKNNVVLLCITGLIIINLVTLIKASENSQYLTIIGGFISLFSSIFTTILLINYIYNITLRNERKYWFENLYEEIKTNCNSFEKFDIILYKTKDRWISLNLDDFFSWIKPKYPVIPFERGYFFTYLPSYSFTALVNSNFHSCIKGFRFGKEELDPFLRISRFYIHCRDFSNISQKWEEHIYQFCKYIQTIKVSSLNNEPNYYLHCKRFYIYLIEDKYQKEIPEPPEIVTVSVIDIKDKILVKNLPNNKRIGIYHRTFFEQLDIDSQIMLKIWENFQGKMNILEKKHLLTFDAFLKYILADQDYIEYNSSLFKICIKIFFLVLMITITIYQLFITL